MTEPDDPLTNRAGELVQEVRGLSNKFNWLKRLTIGLAISFTIDLIITGVLATVVHDQAHLNSQMKQSLAQNYVTAQQQQQTRVQVLCPLYQLLESFAQAPDRTSGMTPAQKTRSDQAAAALLKQYQKLGCPAQSGG